jgi:hypothetical protein
MIDNTMCDELLDMVHLPAVARMRDLTKRVKAVDMTPLEVLAIVAVLESADQRLNAPTAPVLQLLPT